MSQNTIPIESGFNSKRQGFKKQIRKNFFGIKSVQMFGISLKFMNHTLQKKE